MNKLLRIFLKINKYKMINQKCKHKNKNNKQKQHKETGTKTERHSNWTTRGGGSEVGLWSSGRRRNKQLTTIIDLLLF